MARDGSSSDPDYGMVQSDSILGDLGYAVGYALAAILLYWSGLYAISFAYWRRGGDAEAFDWGSLTPPSTDPQTLVFYVSAYVAWLVAALFVVTAVYCAVVRPTQRLLGFLGWGTADGGTATDRAPLVLETTDGTRAIEPDATCTDCDERAIGAIATGFEGDEPSQYLAVCPSHLHERRDEREADDLAVDVRTFAGGGGEGD